MTGSSRVKPSFGKKALLMTAGLAGRLLGKGGANGGRPGPGHVGKILVLELWGIGDVVLATTAMAALRRTYPNARLAVLAKPHAAEILRNCPYVDEFIPYEFPWTRLHGKYNPLHWKPAGLLGVFKRLRSEGFDMAIDVRADIRSNLVMLLSGARTRVGYGAFDNDFMLTDIVPSGGSALHRVDEWIRLIRHVGYEAGNPAPELWLAEPELEEARETLEGLGVGRGEFKAGIHVGASNPSKKWPLERFEELAKRLVERFKIRPVFFIDPDGYGSGVGVKGAVVVKGLSLRKLMALIGCCDIFICNDGGPMHIAAALGVPVFAIFGPTVSSWFGPYGEKHTVIAKDVCEFKPCSDYCRFSGPECLYAISLEEAASVIERRLPGFIAT